MATVNSLSSPALNAHVVRHYHLATRHVAFNITSAAEGETLNIANLERGSNARRVMGQSLSVNGTDGKVGASYSTATGNVTFKVAAGTQGFRLWIMQDGGDSSGQ